MVDLSKDIDIEAIVCYSVNYHIKEATCMRKTLIEKRRKANLTQAQIAKAVGISVTMYSRIENGKRTPSLETALKIAQLLNASVEELFSTNCYPVNK
jgi:putative transcriptional regulator